MSLEDLSIYIKDGYEKLDNKQFDEAITCFDKVLKIDPNYLDALIGMGNVFMDSNQLKKSIDYLDKAIELYPDYGDAWNNKGVVLLRMNKLKMALEYFNKALEIDPNTYYVLMNKGITLYRLNKLQESIDCYKHALNIQPDDDEILMNLGLSLASEEKYGEALKVFDKALEVNDQNILAMYYKADLLEYLENYHEAINLLDDSLRIEPDYLDAILLKGKIFRSLKKYDDALKCYNDVIEVDAQNLDAWVGLGNVFKDLNEQRKMVDAYEKYVEIIRKNGISELSLQARRVNEYLNWVKMGEPITFSPKKKAGYWQWATKSEYFLEDDGSERKALEPNTSLDPGSYWTCHKDTHAGDLILLYRVGTKKGVEYKDIKYLLMARSDAYPLDDDSFAIEEGWDYGCDYIPLFKFKNPLKLSEMQKEPVLEGWNALNALFHRKVYRTDEQYWRYLIDLIVKKNPDYEDFLKDFDRNKIIAKIGTEKKLEDKLEENIIVLNKFGYNLKVDSRQERCIGDDGYIDLLCKDKKTDQYVVIELKIDQANRNTFGQISGYMGWVMENKPTEKPVKGIVVSRGYEKKFKSALRTNPNVEHIELVELVSELGMKLK